MLRERLTTKVDINPNIVLVTPTAIATTKTGDWSESLKRSAQTEHCGLRWPFGRRSSFSQPRAAGNATIPIGSAENAKSHCEPRDSMIGPSASAATTPQTPSDPQHKDYADGPGKADSTDRHGSQLRLQICPRVGVKEQILKQAV